MAMHTLEMKKDDFGRVVLLKEKIKKMREIAALERKTGAQFVDEAVDKAIDLAMRRIRRRRQGPDDLFL